jgi:hypothetical protein
MGIKWTICYCGSHRFYRTVANQNWPCSSSQMNISNCKTKAVFFRGTKDERKKDRNWSENIDTYQPRHNATPTFFLCIKNAPVLGARPTHHQNFVRAHQTAFVQLVRNGPECIEYFFIKTLTRK